MAKLSEKILGFTIDNHLDFVDNISYICKTPNWMLHSEYQLILTQKHVASWLILLLNLTSVIARLLECSVIEKAWGKSANTRTLSTFNDK